MFLLLMGMYITGANWLRLSTAQKKKYLGITQRLMRFKPKYGSRFYTMVMELQNQVHLDLEILQYL